MQHSPTQISRQSFTKTSELPWVGLQPTALQFGKVLLYTNCATNARQLSWLSLYRHTNEGRAQQVPCRVANSTDFPRFSRLLSKALGIFCLCLPDMLPLLVTGLHACAQRDKTGHLLFFNVALLATQTMMF